MQAVRILSVIALTLSLSASNAQNVQYKYIAELPNDPTLYAHDFEEVCSTVNKHYTHLQNKKIDGISLQARYSALVAQAKDNLTYGNILLRYFAELKNGHTSVIFKRYSINCSAQLVEDRVFLSSVRDSSFLQNGIGEKDEIIKINDLTVSDYIRQQAVFTPGSTDLHRTHMTISNLFQSYYEEDRTYTIRTATGERDVTIRFSPRPQQQSAQTNKPVSKIESRLLSDSIAYISILGMTGTVVDDFINAFNQLGSAPYLIIDVRRNQGGNSGNSEKITEHLIKKDLRACVSKRMLHPTENHYKGKLFVLTSPYTFSAAESFVLDLLESGSATLIGMPTGGDTGHQPKFYTSKLGYSYWFPTRKHVQVSEQGFPMEGQSIEPHYLVKRTVEDYLKGEDTVLNYTLRHITSQ